jgi:putative FmdB family regulatory protein
MPLYEFVCTTCDELVEHIFKYSEKPKEVPCPCCGGKAEYRVALPGYFKIKYDQNGRVGFKYDLGDGKKFHRSATREQHEHTVGNRTTKDLQKMGNDKAKSVYTKDYQRHVDAKEKSASEVRTKAMKEELKKSNKFSPK